jgi:hypothetical protein
VIPVLDLLAALDPLLEDAVLVADAVADRGQLQRGERVHEARGEPAEAAVAEPGIAFGLDHLVDVDSSCRC